MKNDEWGQTCSTYGKNKIMQKHQSENMKRRHWLGNIGVGGRIILK
jgi:hypothetical protein